MRILNQQVLTKISHSATAIFFATLLLQSPLSVNGQTTQSNSLEQAKRLNKEVEKLYNAGHYDEAIPYAERALAFQENTLGAEHPLTATALNNLAELYRIKGDYDKAEPLCSRALAICVATGGRRPSSRP